MGRRKEITVRNPFQYVAEKISKIDGEAVGMVSIVAGVALGITADSIYNENFVEKNDEIGTVKNQQQLVAKFSERIDGLKKQKIAIEKAKAGEKVAERFDIELSPEEQKNLEQLKENFINAKKSILTDMHVTGISEDGVGLSEENFAKLYQNILQFVDIESSNIKDTNFSASIKRATGILDETAIDVFKSKDTVSNYATAITINDKLRDVSFNKSLTSVASMIAGLSGGIFGTIFLILAFEKRFENSPQKLKIRLRKRKLPTSH